MIEGDVRFYCQDCSTQFTLLYSTTDNLLPLLFELENVLGKDAEQVLRNLENVKHNREFLENMAQVYNFASDEASAGSPEAVQFPLCKSCTNVLERKINKRIAFLRKEKDILQSLNDATMNGKVLPPFNFDEMVNDVQQRSPPPSSPKFLAESSDNTVKSETMKSAKSNISTVLKKAMSQKVMDSTPKKKNPLKISNMFAEALEKKLKASVVSSDSSSLPPESPHILSMSSSDSSQLFKSDTSFLRTNSSIYENLDEGQIDAALEETFAKLNLLKYKKSILLDEFGMLEKERNSMMEIINDCYGSMSDAYVHASRDFRKYHSHVKDTKALSEEYNALKTTSVLDDSYYICCDGLFGTINGFKLGRLTSIHVSWVEINAALGQCVLLLDSIAKSAAFEFSKFELIPFGSFPKIKRRNDNQIYELFGGQKRVLWNRNFDSAMQGFLTCLSEIGVFADRAESCKLFPHEIDVERITVGGYSVKLNFNQDEKWTRGLKLMLMNLKSLLIWNSRIDQ